MNYDDCIYLTATALARADGLDTRNRELKAFERTAYLEQTKGKRFDLFAAALVATPKARQANTKQMINSLLTKLPELLSEETAHLQRPQLQAYRMWS